MNPPICKAALVTCCLDDQFLLVVPGWLFVGKIKPYLKGLWWPILILLLTCCLDDQFLLVVTLYYFLCSFLIAFVEVEMFFDDSKYNKSLIEAHAAFQLLCLRSLSEQLLCQWCACCISAWLRQSISLLVSDSGLQVGCMMPMIWIQLFYYWNYYWAAHWNSFSYNLYSGIVYSTCSGCLWGRQFKDLTWKAYDDILILKS
jgi:hypothetical protein